MNRNPRPTILCVDDERIVLASLKNELRAQLGPEIRIETAASGEEALQVLSDLEADSSPLSLVISDVRMPGMFGDALLAAVHERSPDTLNILLTGFADLEAITNAVNKAGLFRYIGKPWRREDLILTVRAALRAWTAEILVREKTEAIETITVAMVAALENANLANDEETGLHVRRVGEYSAIIAEGLGAEESFVKRMGVYACLHDIGKVGVPRDLLQTTRLYSPEDKESMKRHVELGARMLAMPGIDPMAGNIARYHHERWDGSGYLEGRAGDAIPLEARIAAVADVFDALTTARPYKPALHAKVALAEILREKGKAFDPAVVAAFENRLDQILELCSCGDLDD